MVGFRAWIELAPLINFEFYRDWRVPDSKPLREIREDSLPFSIELRAGGKGKPSFAAPSPSWPRSIPRLRSGWRRISRIRTRGSWRCARWFTNGEMGSGRLPVSTPASF